MSGPDEPTEEMIHAGCKTLLPALCRDTALPKPGDGPNTRRMIEDARSKVVAVYKAMQGARRD